MLREKKEGDLRKEVAQMEGDDVRERERERERRMREERIEGNIA